MRDPSEDDEDPPGPAPTRLKYYRFCGWLVLNGEDDNLPLAFFLHKPTAQSFASEHSGVVVPANATEGGIASIAHGQLRPGDDHAVLSKLIAEGPCHCNEPDGHCSSCGDVHGHTCIVCDWEWCSECWNGDDHNRECDPKERAEQIA